MYFGPRLEIFFAAFNKEYSFVIKIEAEAVWAMYTPMMTIDALKKCYE